MQSTDFMCLQRGGDEESRWVPFKRLYGGSSTRDNGEPSLVDRSFMTNACPPIAFALPGRINDVDTPPDTESGYAWS